MDAVWPGMAPLTTPIPAADKAATGRVVRHAIHTSAETDMPETPKLIEELVQITPPAAIASWAVAGMSVDQVIATLTILYLLALLSEKAVVWCVRIAKAGLWKSKRK